MIFGLVFTDVFCLVNMFFFFFAHGVAETTIISFAATGEDQPDPPKRGGVTPPRGTGRHPVPPSAGDSGRDCEKEGGEEFRHPGETKGERQQHHRDQ